MHLVAIAWIYVVLMMAVAEATSSDGTLLGAFFTLLLYGVLPLAIVLYLLGTPRDGAPPGARADAAAAPSAPARRSRPRRPCRPVTGRAGTKRTVTARPPCTSRRR